MIDRPQILIVDDEEGPRESTKFILKPDFDVTTTDRGTEALELLRNGTFQVVLLDLTMPADLSGTETLAAIRDAGIDVEVIIITGQGALESARTCFKLGAHDYIGKPYQPDEVRNAIESALVRRTSRLRAESTRESLLANLSHGVRTPLNGILGYTEMLSDEAQDVLSSDQQKVLARIQLSSARLLSYLEGLFFLAELDAGSTVPTPREFAVRPWLERLLGAVRRDAEQNGVAVHIDCDESLTTVSDPETLARLVSALTFAAADQPSGGTVRVHAAATLANRLELSIDPGRLATDPMSDPQSVALADLPIADPIAREVVQRAAAHLGAQLTTHLQGDSIVGLEIEIPRKRRPHRVAPEPPFEDRPAAQVAR